jgi:hypothetical protein
MASAVSNAFAPIEPSGFAAPTILPTTSPRTDSSAETPAWKLRETT